MTSQLRLSRLRLDDGTRDLLGKELAERIAAAELDSDGDEAILGGVGAYTLGRFLQGETLQALQVFCATGHHALILQNLPTQQFPETPVSGFGDETDLVVINALQLGLIRLLGVIPFAVDYENAGRLIRNVVPNPAAAGLTSSWGADSEFSWHTDNPHLPFGAPGLDPRPYVPRYLTFYAIRNEERVPTEVAAVEDVVAGIDPRTRRTLHTPRFTVGAPASNDADPFGQTRQLDGTAVLEDGPHGEPWARFDRGTTEAVDEDAAVALKAWKDALDGAAGEEFVLEAGDFLIFDNYRVLHRRRAFSPHPNAVARWLRRCYAS